MPDGAGERFLDAADSAGIELTPQQRELVGPLAIAIRGFVNDRMGLAEGRLRKWFLILAIILSVAMGAGFGITLYGLNANSEADASRDKALRVSACESGNSSRIDNLRKDVRLVVNLRDGHEAIRQTNQGIVALLSFLEQSAEASPRPLDPALKKVLDDLIMSTQQGSFRLGEEDTSLVKIAKRSAKGNAALDCHVLVFQGKRSFLPIPQDIQTQLKELE